MSTPTLTAAPPTDLSALMRELAVADDPAAQDRAARAIGELGERASAAVPALLDRARREDAPAALALDAIFAAGAPDLVRFAPALEEWLDGPRAPLRRLALRLLARMTAPAVAPGVGSHLARETARLSGELLRWARDRPSREPIPLSLIEGFLLDHLRLEPERAASRGPHERRPEHVTDTGAHAGPTRHRLDVPARELPARRAIDATLQRTLDLDSPPLPDPAGLPEVGAFTVDSAPLPRLRPFHAMVAAVPMPLPIDALSRLGTLVGVGRRHDTAARPTQVTVRGALRRPAPEPRVLPTPQRAPVGAAAAMPPDSDIAELPTLPPAPDTLRRRAATGAATRAFRHDVAREATLPEPESELITSSGGGSMRAPPRSRAAEGVGANTAEPRVEAHDAGWTATCNYVDDSDDDAPDLELDYGSVALEPVGRGGKYARACDAVPSEPALHERAPGGDRGAPSAGVAAPSPRRAAPLPHQELARAAAAPAKKVPPPAPLAAPKPVADGRQMVRYKAKRGSLPDLAVAGALGSADEAPTAKRDAAAPVEQRAAAPLPSRDIPHAEQSLSTEAGRPGPLERTASAMHPVAWLLDRLVGLSVVPAVHAADVVVQGVFGLVAGVWRAVREGAAVRRAAERRGRELPALVAELAVVRGLTGRLLLSAVPDRDAGPPPESTFALGLVWQLRRRLDRLERDAALLSPAHAGAEITRAAVAIFAAVSSGAGLLARGLVDLGLLGSLRPTRREALEIAHDATAAWRQLLALYAGRAAAVDLGDRPEWELGPAEVALFATAELPARPGDRGDLDAWIRIARARTMRLLRLMVHPGPIVDPARWSRIELVRECARGEHVPPLARVELERWVRETLDRLMTGAGVQVTPAERALRAPESRDLATRHALASRLHRRHV